MDVYNVVQQGHADAYMAMYGEGTPEFVVDQGMLYPTASNYGYFCTGYEPPFESDDHHSVFGLDGQDMQYTGAQGDNLPFVYYTPNYGYTQSPYNPYNPYIPGAIIGVDSSFLGSQQYYLPAYDSASSAYGSMVIEARSEYPNTPTIALVDSSTPTVNRADGLGLKHNLSSTSATFNPIPKRTAAEYPNTPTIVLVDSSTPTVNRADGLGLKHNLSSTSATFNPIPKRTAASQTTSFQRSSGGNGSSVGATNKQSAMRGGATLGSFSQAQGRGAHSAQNVAHGKTFSSRDQLTASLSTGNGLTTFGSSSPSSKFIYKWIAEDQKARADVLVEHNIHLRTSKLKRQLIVKAYTRKAGNVDEQGNITIDTEQYNRDDFLLDFQKAKFFIIKSYSEDDVHKSVKYNVWSSTPNGNRKLQGAYDDAQKIAAGAVRGCPIFLFFSVNASGQFCGVAEMTGSVDFSTDMDFWQQDKWSGSFPVKWHFIKDVPNPTFRHIILETNENKPVTSSRDTQEIPLKKGFEMLKIFKSHASRTSLFDDFMYYENRQRILQEERARFLIKSYGSSYIVPTLDPPRKIAVLDMPSDKGVCIVEHNDSDNSKRNVAAAAGHSSSNVSNIGNKSTKPEAEEIASTDSLKIGSLTIGPKKSQCEEIGSLAAITTSKASPVSSTSAADVLTVGSMPIKVDGCAMSSGFLTFGTIPLDPRALSHIEFKNDTNKT